MELGDIAKGLSESPLAYVTAILLLVSAYLYKQARESERTLLETIKENSKEQREILSEVLPLSEKLSDAVEALERLSDRIERGRS